jgi:rubrerythrin
MHATETDEPRPAGAVEELGADPSSRRRLLKAAGATGAAGLFAAVLSACGSSGGPKPTAGGSNPNTGAGVGTDRYGRGDLGIAIFLMTVEYIEVDFYDQALKSGKLKGQAAEIARGFGEQEREHERALAQIVRRLGGEPPARSKPNFPLQSAEAILRFALDIEGVGAAALLGQAGRIEDKSFLAAGLTMHSVEGRHAATIAELLGEDPAPEGPFAKPAFAADVVNQLQTLNAPG